MSSASGGEDSLSSSSLDQMDQLQVYTSEISNDFSDFNGYSSTNSEHEKAQGVRRLLFSGAQLSSHEFSVALMSVYQNILLLIQPSKILNSFSAFFLVQMLYLLHNTWYLKEFVTYDAETIINRCCDTCCQLT